MASPNIARIFREKCRNGEFTGHTTGLDSELMSYAQANIAIIPKSHALDFLLFCQRNSKACPVLEIFDAGSKLSKELAPGADITTDLPKYWVFQDGHFKEEVTNVEKYWSDDMVTFLLGCSFSFEQALIRNGLPVKHIEAKRNVPMYRTNRMCQPAGVFSHLPLVVSMRPYKSDEIAKVFDITGRYPKVHGVPYHVGDPKCIGIKDLSKPDYGDSPVALEDGEIPLFWCCGVTAINAVKEAKIKGITITHAPGHMFVTDVTNDDLAHLD